MTSGATLEIRKPHGEPPGAPDARFFVKMTGAHGPAARALVFVFQIVRAQLIPVPLDQDFTATVAISAGSSGVVDVAGVHVTQSFGHGDFTGARQGRRRRVRLVQHPEIRMKRGKMKRHVHPDLAGDPLAHPVNFFVGIVEVRDQQRGNFKPDICFPFQINQRVQYRPQRAEGNVTVKFFREPFEVHVGRVHVFVKFRAGFVRHVPGGDSHGLDAELMAFWAGDDHREAQWRLDI